MRPVKTVLFGLALTFAGLLIFWLLNTPPRAVDRKADPPGPTALFDGNSLAGWSGAENLWQVVDGAITGQTTEAAPLTHNSFLVCEQDLPGDFELNLQFRIEGGNSGVQIRSEQFEPHRVRGYQADIDSKMTYMGILYEEGGRGILCQRGESNTIDAAGKQEKTALQPAFDDALFTGKIQPDQWHDYSITARGSRLEFRIDGITTAVLDDRETGKSREDGILALQLHAGPPMKVQFRDIQLTSLAEPQTAKPAE